VSHPRTALFHSETGSLAPLLHWKVVEVLMMFLLLACAHQVTVLAPLQYGSGILEVQVRPEGIAQMEGNLMGPVEPYGGNFELNMCSSILKYMTEAGGYQGF
jgi:hypothetical protein